MSRTNRAVVQVFTTSLVCFVAEAFSAAIGRWRAGAGATATSFSDWAFIGFTRDVATAPATPLAPRTA